MHSEAGQLTLDSPIGSGGSNVSVGQRQIIALARAILRRSKVLILDEGALFVEAGLTTVYWQKYTNHLATSAIGQFVSIWQSSYVSLLRPWHRLRDRCGDPGSSAQRSCERCHTAHRGTSSTNHHGFRQNCTSLVLLVYGSLLRSEVLDCQMVLEEGSIVSLGLHITQGICDWPTIVGGVWKAKRTAGEQERDSSRSGGC